MIFDSFPDLVIPAKIKEIGSEASETTRTYPVTLIMEQPDGVAILPGMAGKASPKDPPPVPPEIAGSGLIVPDTALFTLPDDSRTYVWVLDPEAGIVHRREVRTGNITRFGLGGPRRRGAGRVDGHGRRAYLEEGQQVRLLEESGRRGGDRAMNLHCACPQKPRGDATSSPRSSSSAAS